MDAATCPSGQYDDKFHCYPDYMAMVDSDDKLLVDIIVRPPSDELGMMSYLTPLTGVTDEICIALDARPLDEAIDIEWCPCRG